MPISDHQHRLIDSFRMRIEERFRKRWPAPQRHNRADGYRFITRWALEPRIWAELAICPSLPQVRAGVMTDDALRSRDFETIAAADDQTIEEFVKQGFRAAGITCPNRPVEHYCEWAREFHFDIPFDLKSLESLSDPAFAEEVGGVLEGYAAVFCPGAVPLQSHERPDR